MLYTELHRHLDASFRPRLLLNCIRDFKIESPLQTEDDVRRKFWLTSQMNSLEEVLDCFVLFQKCLGSQEILKTLATQAVEDASTEQIGWLELRYSPSFTSAKSKISWVEALNSFWNGVQEAGIRTGVKTGLICIVSREFGIEMAERTIDFALENIDKFIGVDLAGPEEGFPCRLYSRIFQKVQAAGLPITIHAGEASGPENVWEAIDLLGARRIGHGIRSIEDPELIKRLARDKILLEACPTSNFITRSVPSFQTHPLPKFLDAGVPVSISTDDPGIFGVPLPEEYERCRTRLEMSTNDLAQINRYAFEHSFINERSTGAVGPAAPL